MKTLYLSCLMTALAFIAKAQNKIVISYDENGNRVKRERICPTCRPAASNNSNAPSDAFAAPVALAGQEGKAGTFRVYPNPAGNFVTLYLDFVSLQQKCTVVLMDQSGREHFRKQAATATTEIPLAKLADGMYYVILFRDNQKDVVRVVKETGAGQAR
ncbi:T9SS type A sorting domain-containing protein [Taibaiella chishuiensis]|uniref:Putative secreted protein (Por secretion system target) n=1 Tax=Taibaiella chishuiensis TaxID=1434707 RepID=A0A2P8DD18_9BACT|nr:T9SS type A sorting domain-containing protein [Taibaiella chishuiensis]PSK95067.1 putative secreted protein (Por secretion system target) [Taibaiella chishuiensis]